MLNPKSGWIYNSNDWPWAVSGPDSPKRESFPAYVENGGPSARGQHAVRVLENKKDFTLDGLIAAAYDSYLTWFEKPMPALIKAWDATAGFESAEGEDGGTDRGAAQVGLAVGRGFRADIARGFLGQRNTAEHGRR